VLFVDCVVVGDHGIVLWLVFLYVEVVGVVVHERVEFLERVWV